MKRGPTHQAPSRRRPRASIPFSVILYQMRRPASRGLGSRSPPVPDPLFGRLFFAAPFAFLSPDAPLLRLGVPLVPRVLPFAGRKDEIAVFVVRGERDGREVGAADALKALRELVVVGRDAYRAAGAVGLEVLGHQVDQAALVGYHVEGGADVEVVEEDVDLLAPEAGELLADDRQARAEVVGEGLAGGHEAGGDFRDERLLSDAPGGGGAVDREVERLGLLGFVALFERVSEKTGEGGPPVIVVEEVVGEVAEGSVAVLAYLPDQGGFPDAVAAHERVDVAELDVDEAFAPLALVEDLVLVVVVPRVDLESHWF